MNDFPVVFTESVTKSYNSLTVLHNVSIAVSIGEIVAITGPSGAGKTTFLQIVGTLDKADSGMIKINNQDISQLKGNQLASFRNKNIGFVFQFHHLLPEFTALENICIPAFISGKTKVEATNEAMRYLEFLNLTQRAHHKPSELSGGEAQRIAVARALINNPTIVLADEPSGNLDEENSNDLHELFLKLKNEFNQTFIIVTHDQTLASKSDRIIKLKDGVVV